MNRHGRLIMILIAAPISAAAVVWGCLGLPQFGHTPAIYGTAIDHLTVVQQRITDAVTAVNFDYRGTDTIGEEFILFAAVMAVSVLLRHLRAEGRELTTGRALSRLRPASELVRTLCIGATAPIMVLGIYVVSHGQLTPGGGFQGGAILASGVVMVLLAGEYVSYRRFTPARLMELAEAVGAGGYVAMGLVGLVAGANFLQNIVPLGQLKQIDSAGMVGIISALVGLEVAAGLVQVISELLEQTLAIPVGHR